MSKPCKTFSLKKSAQPAQTDRRKLQNEELHNSHSFTKYYQSDQIKDDEIRKHVVRMEEIHTF